ncbi:MAG: transporter [Adhaeribacter sp.]
MKVKLLICLGAVLLPFWGRAQGAEELKTDRPSQTQGPEVVPRGSWQVETGMQYQKEKMTAFKHKQLLYPEALLRVGLLEQAELRLQGAYKKEAWDRIDPTLGANPEDRKGWENLQVGTKVHLWEGRGILPETGLLAYATLPVGKKQLRPGQVLPDGRLLFENKISDKLALQYNAGYRKRPDPEESPGELVYSASANLKLGDKLTCFTEFFGFKARQARPENTLDAGLLVLLLPSLQWDFIGGLGLSQSAPDFFAGTGLSWRWDK